MLEQFYIQKFLSILQQTGFLYYIYWEENISKIMMDNICKQLSQVQFKKIINGKEVIVNLKIHRYEENKSKVLYINLGE